MTNYGYMVQTIRPKPKRQRDFLRGCHMIFFDQSQWLPRPFMERPEARLLILKLKPEDRVFVHDLFLLGTEGLDDLQTFCRNRRIVLVDSKGHTLDDRPDSTEMLAQYHTECDRLRLTGTPWEKTGIPFGWKLEKDNKSRNRLVRDSKARAWAEMLMALADEHAFKSADFARLWHTPRQTAMAAARNGFPINSEWDWAGASGLEDRMCRRRNTYMTILGILNGRALTIRGIYSVLDSKGIRLTFVKRRVYELARMGAVKRCIGEDHLPVYSRDWDWQGDAKAFSILAMAREIHHSPATAGELSKKFITPRWLIVDVLSAIQDQCSGLRVSFDRKHRAVYRLETDPDSLDYHALKQKLRFAAPARNASARISRLRSRVIDGAQPRTCGNARPRRRP
jgi:hypothetical protein